MFRFSGECFMKHLDQFYINGGWVKPSGDAKPHEVINPATEASEGTVYLAGKADVDAAIQAARDAFESFAATPLPTITAVGVARPSAHGHAITSTAQPNMKARSWPFFRPQCVA